MSVINFYEEAIKSEKKSEHRVINNIVKADSFDISILVEDNLAKTRLHLIKNSPRITLTPRNQIPEPISSPSKNPPAEANL